MSIITIILLISTLAFGWYVCIDVLRYILRQHWQHEMEKRFWQIRRKEIRKQAHEKAKNTTPEGRFHENHRN